MQNSKVKIAVLVLLALGVLSTLPWLLKQRRDQKFFGEFVQHKTVSGTVSRLSNDRIYFVVKTVISSPGQSAESDKVELLENTALVNDQTQFVEVPATSREFKPINREMIQIGSKILVYYDREAESGKFEAIKIQLK